MKYVKVFSIAIIFFVCSCFANISTVSAICAPSSPGNPACSDNSSSSNPAPTPTQCIPGAGGSGCIQTTPNPAPTPTQCLSGAAGSGCTPTTPNQNQTPSTPESNDSGSTTEPSEDEFYKPIDGDGYECGGLISTSLLKEINKIYKTVSLVMVVAVVIFGMLDFFKAVSAGDADTMKKVTKKFSYRIVIVIILAILPMLLDFILTLFGDDNMRNCLDKIG